MAPRAPQDVQLGLPEAAPTGTQVTSRGHCEPPPVHPRLPRGHAHSQPTTTNPKP